jgi:hypothetical protein
MVMAMRCDLSLIRAVGRTAGLIAGDEAAVDGFPVSTRQREVTEGECLVKFGAQGQSLMAAVGGVDDGLVRPSSIWV